MGTSGYCDDCYALGNDTKSLKVVEGVTDEWLRLTGQEMNPSKSVVFATNNPDPVEIAFCGEPIPRKAAFKSLGIEVVPDGEDKTGEIIQARIAKARPCWAERPQLRGDSPGGRQSF